MKLASIRIVTHDVTALAAFYATVTGVSPSGDNLYSELRTSGCTLAIADPGLVESLYPGQLATSANRSAILEFEVDDVDGLRSKLSGVVTDWVQEPTTMPWGNRSMLFHDPDDNMINIYSRPRQAE